MLIRGHTGSVLKSTARIELGLLLAGEEWLLGRRPPLGGLTRDLQSVGGRRLPLRFLD